MTLDVILSSIPGCVSRNGETPMTPVIVETARIAPAPGRSRADAVMDRAMESGARRACFPAMDMGGAGTASRITHDASPATCEGA
jgi:hypothetical protein